MPIDHLPARFRPVAVRLRDFLLTDATALLILGVVSVARAASYIPAPVMSPDAFSHPAESWASMSVWAVLWTAVGVLCLASVPRHKSPVAALAVGLVIAFHALWAISFVYASLSGQMPRGWVSSINYWAVIALALWAVWRGSKVDIRIVERTERGQ